jgi:DNA polymerase III delta prime subunit
MNETLLMKYKPTKWDEFHFDENLSNIFQMYIDINKIKLLISGKHGIGKTTLIKVIINEYFKNNNKKDINENVLYVNPLKEQGIHYYRNDVKHFCQTYCTIKGKKKIVIMDDFDLVHEQSQQVFRSIVDNYENNVHFIISTSDIFKIVESIQSRFTNIVLPHFDKTFINNLCNKICNNENITFIKNSREIFLSICDNNIQLMLQYLEGFRLLKKNIDEQIIFDMCSHVNFSKMNLYFQYLQENRLEEGIEILFNLYHDGFSVMDILDSIFNYVKTEQVDIQEEIKYKLIKYLCKYITIFHEIHEEEIELALFTNNIIKLFRE